MNSSAGRRKDRVDLLGRVIAFSLMSAATCAAAQKPLAPAVASTATPTSRPLPDPRYLEAPRAAAPSLALSLEAATTAVAECKKGGYAVTVQVSDAAGEIVVLLSGDGAGIRSLRLMKPKPVSVYMHKTPSSQARELAKTDPVLAEAIKGDSAILFGGSVPILVGGDMIGAITVSGMPNGTLDEACANAGLDKIRSRLVAAKP